MKLLQELYFLNSEPTSLRTMLENLERRCNSLSKKISEILLTEATDLTFANRNVTLPDLQQNIFKLHDMLVNAFRGLDAVGNLPNPEAQDKHAKAIGENIKKIVARLNTLEKELDYYVNKRLTNIYDKPNRLNPALDPAAPLAQPRGPARDRNGRYMRRTADL